MKLSYILLAGVSTALLMSGPSMAQVTKIKPKPRVQIQQPNKVSQPRIPPKNLGARSALPGRIEDNPLNFETKNFPEPSQAKQDMHKVMKVCKYEVKMLTRSLEIDGKQSQLSGANLYVWLKGSNIKNEPYEISRKGSQQNFSNTPLSATWFRIVDDSDSANVNIGRDGSYITQNVQRENWNYFKGVIDNDKGVCFGTKLVYEENSQAGAVTHSAQAQMWTGGECRCRTR